MMRMESDLYHLCLAAVNKTLADQTVSWTNQVALGVVLAAGGYPADYNKGDKIEGLEGIDGKDCKVFHAGTQQQNGNIVTAGGRVYV